MASILAHDLHFRGVGDNALLRSPDWQLFGLEAEDALGELRRLSLRGELIVQSEVSDRLAVLAELSLADLRLEWRRLFRADPPRLSRDIMLRAIAYRLQEIAHGGASKVTQRRLMTLTAEFDPKTSAAEVINPPIALWVWGDRILTPDRLGAFADAHNVRPRPWRPLAAQHELLQARHQRIGEHRGRSAGEGVERLADRLPVRLDDAGEHRGSRRRRRTRIVRGYVSDVVAPEPGP